MITNTLFPGPVYQGYGKMIAENRYEPALFKARLGLKDVRLALAAGDAVNAPLPVASLVRDNLIERSPMATATRTSRCWEKSRRGARGRRCDQYGLIFARR